MADRRRLADPTVHVPVEHVEVRAADPDIGHGDLNLPCTRLDRLALLDRHRARAYVACCQHADRLLLAPSQAAPDHSPTRPHKKHNTYAVAVIVGPVTSKQPPRDHTSSEQN